MIGRVRSALVLCALSMSMACGGDGPLPSWRPTPTPHEAYADTLRDANLDGFALGRAWIEAATQALVQPERVDLPFRESGYLDPASPSAVAYRFTLERGRVLDIDVTFEATGPAAAPAGPAPALFIDLFLVRDDGVDRLASAEEGSLTLRYAARRQGDYVLRLQPELLAGGRYSIVQRTEASLRFPVEGAGERNIQSVFGDARDGGSRRHHGVDIFARRGTPVLAANDGYVRRVDTTEIGGRVVWLSDAKYGQSIYYAHLDDWAVRNGQEVKAGDVLGYVGNTGNARTTPPHLHFGIYSGGPVDPLPFIRADDDVPPRPSADAALIGDWARTARAGVELSASPARDREPLASLEPGTAVLVKAASGSRLRVWLPDGRTGYVEARSVTPLARPLATRTLDADTALLSAPVGGVLVDRIARPTRADVLAEFSGFALVEAAGRRAWVSSGGTAGP